MTEKKKVIESSVLLRKTLLESLSFIRIAFVYRFVVFVSFVYLLSVYNKLSGLTLTIKIGGKF
jgi:hypothetical protein